MSVVFTRHDKGQTGRGETNEPVRQTAIAPVNSGVNVAALVETQPKTIAEYIKTYGQAKWKQFRETILATPSTVNYLQASDAYAKSSVNLLMLVTEAEITQRVIDMWKVQLASQQKATQDGLAFIAERWANLSVQTQKFASAITGAFVGTKEQMQEQFKGGTVYWVPKKFKPAAQKVQSPLGPVPVAEMNDPVGKITIPSAAAFWFSQSNSDITKAAGGAIVDPLPNSANPAPMLPFLQWVIKQGSTLFRKDVADWWDETQMTLALAKFGEAVSGRVALLQNMQGLPQAIANNEKYLKNELAPQIKAAEKAVAETQNAAMAALTKVGSGVPAECATAQSQMNFELQLALATLVATEKLNEAVKAGLTTTGNIIADMEGLQTKLANAKTQAEKELIAAQIVAISGKGAADLSRVGKRLGDRKGKIADAGERADKAVAIADAHGLDGQAARQAAQTIANQRKAATELNVAHEKTKEAEAGEIVRILKEVEKDMGEHSAGAAGEIVAALQGGGDGSGDSGSGALWLIAAAVGAKFLLF